MTSQITLSIPLDAATLNRIANMLGMLADTLVDTEIQKPAVSVPIEVVSMARPTKSFGLYCQQFGRAETPTLDETSPSEVFALAPATEVSAAPPASAPAPEAAADLISLDSAGLPWDERIHSSSKKKLVKTQTWKKKKGVDPSLVATVESELRKLMEIPSPQTVPSPTPGHAEAAKQLIEELSPTPPPPPAAAPVAPPLPPISTFPELAKAVTERQITAEVVTAACQKHHVPSFVMLSTRPDLIPAIAKELGLSA